MKEHKMSDQPRLSLVVCTRNRASQLPKALEAFEKIHSNQAWELVLVDNGSTDSTPEIIERFAANCRHPVHIMNAPQPGLSRARNVGWKAAHGDVIAFTDDDCYPSADYVDAMLDCFTDPKIGFVGGRVTLHDPEDYSISILTTMEPQDFAAASFIQAGTIHGCNMAFRREALDAIGEFDEALGAGTKLQSGEDIDALAGVLASGYQGRYDPRPVVAHHHGRKPGDDISKLRYGYDLGRGAYFYKGLTRPGCRLKFLRAWLDSVRYRVRHRQNIRSILNEIRGACLYAMKPN